MSSQSQQTQQSLYDAKKSAQANYDGAKSTVQDQAHKLHQGIVRPTAQRLQEMAEHRPIMATFGTIMLATSIIPLMSFLAFSVGTAVVFAGIATFWSAVVISGAAVVLGLTLMVTTIIASFVSFWSMVGYVGIRLLANVSMASSLPQGIKNFRNEMYNMVYGHSHHGQSTSDSIKSAAGDVGEKIKGNQ